MRFFIASLLILSASTAASTSPNSFNVRGQLFDASGVELSTTTNFKLELLDQSETCVLYTEDHSGIDLSQSEGRFNLIFSEGSNRENKVTNGTALTMDLFRNDQSFGAFTDCGAGVTINAGDIRKIRVSFDEGSGYEVLSPSISIRGSAYSMIARSLNGKIESDFIQVNTTTAGVTQPQVESIFDGAANYSELLALVTGTSNLYAKQSSNGASSLPGFNSATPPASPQAGDIWFEADTGQVMYHDGASVLNMSAGGGGAGGVTSVTAGSGLTGGTITASGTIAVAAGGITDAHLSSGIDAAKITVGTLPAAQLPDMDASKITTGVLNSSLIPSGTDSTKLPLSGGSLSGSVVLESESEVRFADADSSNYIGLKSPSAVSSDVVFTLPLVDGGSGHVLQTDGSGQLSFIPIPSAAVTTVHGRVGDVVAQAGDYVASQVGYTSGGDLSSTNLQGAIDELDTEKAAKARLIATATGSGLSGGGDLSSDRNLSVDIGGVASLGSAADNADTLLLRDDTDGSLKQVSRSELVLSESEVDSYVGNNGYLSSVSVVDVPDLPASKITSGILSSARLDVGTGANQIVQLDGTGALPAIDGSALTGVVGTDSTKLPLSGGSLSGSVVLESESEVRFADADSSNYIGLKSPSAVSSDVVFTLPLVDGGSGHVLQTDGSGQLSFIPIPSAAVTTVHGRVGDVVAQAGDYVASQVGYTSGGDLSSTNLQGAIDELDTEKAAKARLIATATGSGLSGGGDLSSDRNLSVDIGGVASLGSAADNADTLLLRDDTDGSLKQVSRSELVLSESEVDSYVGNNGYLSSVSVVDVPDLPASKITSGILSSARLDVGTGANQIVQLDGTGALPAIDGSALTGVVGTDSTKLPLSGGSLSGSVVLESESEVRFADADSSNYIGLKSPSAVSSDVVFTLPLVDGGSGHVLQTDGSGQLSFIPIPSAAVTTVHGRVGDVVAQAGDYVASQITNTPAGNISSATVQGAVNELDTEKVSSTLTLSTNAGSGLSGGGDLSSARSLSVDVNNATVETVASGTDSLLIYDASAAATRKMTRSNFLSGYLSATIGSAAGNVMAADAVPGCSSGQKLQMSAGPIFSWSCVNESLGDHTATTNIALNSNWLSNDGTNKGLRIDNSGQVGVGMETPNAMLTVEGTLSLKELAAAPSDDSGYGKLFIKSTDSDLYYKDDNGTEHNLLSGGGGGGANTGVVGDTRASGPEINIGVTSGADANTLLSSPQGVGVAAGVNQNLIVSSYGTGISMGGRDTFGNNLIIGAYSLGVAIGENITLQNSANDTTMAFGRNWNLDGDNLYALGTGDSSPITGDDQLLIGGVDVGIGTNTPNERLTVSGAFSMEEQAVDPLATLGFGKLFVKSSDSKLYYLDASGTEYDLLGGGASGGSLGGDRGLNQQVSVGSTEGSYANSITTNGNFSMGFAMGFSQDVTVENYGTALSFGGRSVTGNTLNIGNHALGVAIGEKITLQNSDHETSMAFGENWNLQGDGLYAIGTGNGTLVAGSNLLLIDGVDVGIGTSVPSSGDEDLKLDVEGAIGASQFCDANGNNCFTAATVNNDVTAAAIPSGNSFPGSPNIGDVFFNTDDSKIYVHDGSGWTQSGGNGDLSSESSVQFPTVTTAERDALSVNEGTLVYNSDTQTLDIYKDGQWDKLVNGTTANAFVAGFLEVKAGKDFSCGRMSDKTLRCWGENVNGRLGNGQTTDTISPVAVYKETGEPVDDAIQLSVGYNHSCYVAESGEVYCWGLGNEGQIGDGTNTSRNEFAKKVSGISSAIEVSSGGSHSCAVLTGGGVKCWGNNSYGQLGVGSNSPSSSNIPVDATEFSNIRHMNLGYGSTCAVQNDNTLYCLGYNNHGQLGNGSTSTSYNSVLVMTSVNKVNMAIGSYTSTDSITYHYQTTCALKQSGEVWCWGQGAYGALGNGATSASYNPVHVKYDTNDDQSADGFITNAINISGGSSTMCATLVDNTAMCWGRNTYRGIGDKTNTDRSLAVPVLNFEGTAPLADVISIAVGEYYVNRTHAVTADGAALSWGYNHVGSLGIDLQASSTIPDPTQVKQTDGGGSKVTEDSIINAHLAEDSVGTSEIQDSAVTLDKIDFSSTTKGLKIPVMSESQRDAIAPAEEGMILLNTDTNDMNIFANAAWKTITDGGGGGALTSNEVDTTHINSGAVTIDKIDLSSTTSGLTFSNMSLAQRDAIATPQEGMMVYNTTTKRLNVFSNGAWSEVGGGSGIDEVFLDIAGSSATGCSLMSGGTVKCWGYNSSGTWGNGGSNAQTRGTLEEVRKMDGSKLTQVVQLEAGHEHMCARTSTGDLYCWGQGANGRLGVGNTTDAYFAQEVDSLSGQVIDVAAGYRHTCAVLNDNTLKCWGNGSTGGLGQGANASSNLPVFASITDVKDVDAGSDHTCAIKTDDSLWCWGSNNHGQLGVGNRTSSNTPVSVMSGVKEVSAAIYSQTSYYYRSYTCAVKLDGTAWCWGRGTSGALGYDSSTQQTSPVQVQFDSNLDNASDGNLTDVVSINSNEYVSCAIKSDKTVWCWGANSYYNLGDNTNTVRDNAVQVMDNSGSNPMTGVVDVAIGGNSGGTQYTLLVKEDGTAHAWGYGANYQLATNTNSNLNNPVQIYTEDSGNGLAESTVTSIHLADQSVTDVKMNGISAPCAADQILVTDGSGGFTCNNGSTLSSADNSITDAVIVDNSGQVGIGESSPAHKLHVNGSVAGVGAYVNLSDNRLKRDLASIKSPVDKLLSLRGLTFDWRHDEYPSYEFPEGRDMGLIAQDVEKVFPEAVVKNSNGILSVAYSKLLAPVIEAIKTIFQKFDVVEKKQSQSHQQIEILKQKNNRLEQKNLQLEKRLERLEQAIMNQ